MEAPISLEWAKELGMPDNYFPVAINFRLGEVRAPMAELVQAMSVTIYAVDTAVAGDSADEIKRYAQVNGHVPVKEWDGLCSLSDMAKYIKRFEVVAKREKSLGDFEFVTEEA